MMEISHDDALLLVKTLRLAHRCSCQDCKQTFAALEYYIEQQRKLVPFTRQNSEGV